MSRTNLLVRSAATSLLAAGLLSLPASAGAAPTAAPDLTGAVTASLLRSAGADAGAARGAAPTGARIDVTRRAGDDWAFGTAVLPAPRVEGAYPTGSVFIAHAGAKGWEVALDGEAAFSRLAAEAPVVSAEEKRVFSTPVTTYAGGDMRTGMQLPWAVGQSWYFTGGPHGWGGSAPPWSSADFAGGDQIVRAVRGGTAYTMCTGWIRVIHDRGYSTDYYHLWSSIGVNGAAVGAGAYLGYTGTDVTCGGSASGRHVHFGLRQHGAYVGLPGHDLGKWAFIGGASAYTGSARHGSALVGTGGLLYNYGALGLNQAVIDANGGGAANKRTGPGTGYAVAGSVGDGATVTVSCSANGTTHTGRYGASALWNRLSDGTWVSDAYMWTGVNGPINGWC